MTNRVNFDLIPFPPIQWTGDIFQLGQLLADHLQGDLDNSVFTGQLDGSEPSTNIGLWLDNDVWKRWDVDLATYLPLGIVAGLTTNGVTRLTRLSATSTDADVALDLPDKSGTLARIEDIYAPVETTTHTGNTITIDWTKLKTYIVIAGNATVVDGGSGDDGAQVVLFVETPPGHGTPLTITFPAVWRKDDATLGSTDATHRTVDRFLIERVGTDTFVTKIGEYSIDQSGGGDPTHGGGDTTPPTYVSSVAQAYNTGNKIRLTFSELVTGTSPASAWVVTKDGNNQTINTVIVGESGNQVLLYINSQITPTSHITVRYNSDNSVKDVAGNNAASFGPVTVPISV